MCYHIEFCCSASKGVRKHGREQPNLGSTGDPAPLRQGEAVLQEIPPDVVPSEFVRFRSNGKALQAYLQRFAWKKIDPSCPARRDTQGHRNRQGSISDQGLPINVP